MNRRALKPDYLLIAAFILLYVLSFWTLGTELRRLEVRVLSAESSVRSMTSRVIERWTRGDHTAWVQELGRANPTLTMPPVPPAHGVSADPKLPGEGEGAKP